MMPFVLVPFEKHFKAPLKVSSSTKSVDLRVRIEGCAKWDVINHMKIIQ